VNCQETREVIHAYADGELDLVKNLEIDQHLRDCPACARSRSEILQVRTALQGGSLYYSAPPDLRGRILELLPVSSPSRQTRRLFGWRKLAFAASLFICGVTGWGVAHILTPASHETFLAQQLVASYIRSQMLAIHALDATSSDRHTVRPWFEGQGKLDFSPPVPDLKGFPLVGGRLDYLDERPVAVLVYQSGEHFINLFIWRTKAATDSSLRTRTQQSYHLISWTSGGLSFWAVSSVSEDELKEFAQLVRSITGGQPRVTLETRSTHVPAGAAIRASPINAVGIPRERSQRVTIIRMPRSSSVAPRRHRPTASTPRAERFCAGELGRRSADVFKIAVSTAERLVVQTVAIACLPGKEVQVANDVWRHDSRLFSIPFKTVAYSWLRVENRWEDHSGAGTAWQQSSE
jgi:anti-sigma factor RsiW